MAISVHVDIWLVRMVGIKLHDREQWQAEVADSPEHAVQRGLVDDRALDEGGAVALVAEVQAIKPNGPAGIQVPLQANCIVSGLVRFAHGALFAVLLSCVAHLGGPPLVVRPFVGLSTG